VDLLKWIVDSTFVSGTLCVCVCVYVCMYVCMHACMHAHVPMCVCMKKEYVMILLSFSVVNEDGNTGFG
jgi:hypothetical protein